MIIIDGMPKYLGFDDAPQDEHRNLNLLMSEYDCNAPYPITPTHPAPTQSQVMKF